MRQFKILFGAACLLLSKAAFYIASAKIFVFKKSLYKKTALESIKKVVLSKTYV